ncbi:MAG: hypothetical protein HZB29_00490 [Nitrospinae bacterium]|nr:hypothetical protein [Nitrospinota bacterium]
MKQYDFKPVLLGVILALLAILGGTLHGMSFGAKEESIKEHFKTTAGYHIAEHGSIENANKSIEDAWKYLKRAHEHFMGLGTAALALSIFAGLSPAAAAVKRVVSTAVGLGAVIYPSFWTLTAFKTAQIGGHAAKESLAIMAQAGAGLFFLGLLGTIGVAAGWALAKPKVY